MQPKEQQVLHNGQKVSTQTKEHSGSREGVRTLRGKGEKKFDPYSQRSRQNVKDVIKALENLVGEDDRPKQLDTVSSTAGKSQKQKPVGRAELPQSPIYKKQRKKDIPFKQLLSPAEQQLVHDPWARMLAEPIRLCRGSGIRLPISLLSDWRLTLHPTNGEVYLLPSQLADVEKMEKVSRRQEMRWRRKMGLTAAEDEHAPLEESDPLDELASDAEEADEAGTSGLERSAPETHPPASYQRLSTTSLHPGTMPAVRILLYDNLINLFSLTTLRQFRSRVNTTVRLLPRLWLDRFEQARHYDRNREAFEKLTGEKDTSPPTIEATLDLNKLQWQTDIGERLLSILRARIISAFKRIAMLNAQDKKRKLRHMSAIPMSRVRDLLYHNGSISVHVNDHENATSFQLPSEDASSTDDATKTYSKYPQDFVVDEAGVQVERALAPRFFLYLGPRGAPGIAEFVKPDRQGMIPPLLPSLVEKIAQRFPIFPIRAMLGEEFYSELLEQLKIHGHLQADKLETLNTSRGDHLLMLKPSAGNDFIEGLLRAVWRLWRYGGGRRWMDPDNDDYEGWKEILSEMHKLQARHVGGVDADAVTEGMQELVREVEEGAMEDHDLEERAIKDSEGERAAKRAARIGRDLE